MKFLIAGMLCFLSITQAVAATPGTLTPAEIDKAVVEAKRSVIELSNELSRIESELLTPDSTKASIFFSIKGGRFFKPLSVKIEGPGFHPVSYVYTEEEVSALRFGAVQPLGDVDLGQGRHWVKVQIRGLDERGQVRDVLYEGTFQKGDKHLKLLVSLADNTAQRSAVATVKAW